MGLCRKAIYSIISTYTVSQKVIGLLVKQVTQKQRWYQTSGQGLTPKKKELLSRINLILKTNTSYQFTLSQLNWTVYLWYDCQVKTYTFTTWWSQVLLKNHFTERKEII